MQFLLPPALAFFCPLFTITRDHAGWRSIKCCVVLIVESGSDETCLMLDGHTEVATVGYLPPHTHTGASYFECPHYKQIFTRTDTVLHHLRVIVESLTLRLLMSHIYIYIYIYIYMEHLFLVFLDHTQRRSTVGRTPLDE